jgi:serine protease Do
MRPDAVHFNGAKQPMRLSLMLILLVACGASAVAQSTKTLGLTAMAPTANGTPTLNKEEQARIEAAVARVKPALVRIQVVEANYYEGRSHKQEASGSGAIVSAQGYIVTNHHVAGNAVRLVCTLSNREEVPAVLIGTDPLSDISVIQLKPDKPRVWPFVNWSDSGKLEVGDPVLAMGSPLALSQSVTKGIISNTQMTMPAWSGGMELDGEDVGSIVRWLAHDAQIFPGNSGGPLVNLNGDIIGINEISYGLGGAIPSAIARPVVEALIANHKIDRAFLGLMLQPSFKFEDGKGAIVSDAIKDSPAAKAGLKPGDRLVSITPADGEKNEIHVRFAEELPPLNLWMATQPLNKPLTLTFERDGKTQSKKVTPILREPVLRQRREFKLWGITARDLSIWTALEMKRPNTDGVLVTSVRAGGPAGQAKPSLQEGDIILKMGEEKIANMDELNTVTQRLTKGKSEPVPVLVSYARKGAMLLTVVAVGIDELDDPGREVIKAWLPIDTQVLTAELAKELGQEDKTGVRVTQVYDVGNTSGTLGLKVGDLIVAVGGEPIQAREEHDEEVFPKLIRDYKIGSEVTLSVIRDGKPLELKGKLVAAPLKPREMTRYQDFDFEFTARDTAYLDRVGKQLKDETRGVQIDSVDDGGWAALGRLQAGDTLLTINGEPTPDVKTLRACMLKIKNEKTAHVIFKIQRGVHTLFIELEPLWEQAKS